MARLVLQAGLGIALLAGLLATLQPATAQTLTTLYSFTSGSNAYGPQAGLVMDGQGNLYGTTVGDALGQVFQLTPDGTLNILHAFSFSKGAHADGYGAYNRLVRDANGNLFGTTAFGGAYGKGTVFKLAPDGTETLLHSFRGNQKANDGKEPDTTLVLDGQGDLYGTTFLGGTSKKGTVFKVTPDGTESVLYSFGPRSSGDGEYPFNGGLVMDAKGSLYGATQMGGILNCPPHMHTYGCGAVFEIGPSGQETVLYKFKGDSNNDGWAPIGGLVRDGQGNLFGMTLSGTLYKVTPSGGETILHRFLGGDDGSSPYAGLVADAQGNLYGTTYYGGGTGCDYGFGCGTIFKVTPDGTETVLYRFTGGSDGGYPLAQLVFDGNGNLYGTTWRYGVGNGGTVFRLTP